LFNYLLIYRAVSLKLEYLKLALNPGCSYDYAEARARYPACVKKG